jgi:dTDP-4-amino-4,6-dideoxygalactose transaminase
MYYLVFRSLEERTSMIAHLRAQDIFAVFHYLPLNTSEMGMRFGGRAGQCPVAESVSDRLLRLPFYNNLTAEEQGWVIDAVRSWRKGADPA